MGKGLESAERYATGPSSRMDKAKGGIRIRQNPASNHEDARADDERNRCPPWWLASACQRSAYKEGFGTWVLIYRAEVVEILFSRGLVKVLFATETFAMVGDQSASWPFAYTISRRASICPPRAWSSPVSANMTVTRSETSCLASTPRWRDEQDGVVLILPGLSSS
jgi:hypothetical protein